MAGETFSRIVTKTGEIEWNGAPEGFDCRLRREQVTTYEPDPKDPKKTIPVSRIEWCLTTGYALLTAEGERIWQEDEWLLPPSGALVAEDIRSQVIARIKGRNSIP